MGIVIHNRQGFGFFARHLIFNSKDRVFVSSVVVYTLQYKYTRQLTIISQSVNNNHTTIYNIYVAVGTVSKMVTNRIEVAV